MSEAKLSEASFEFCSHEWVEMANAFVQDAAAEVDLTGINYTFNEIFTDAPAHLGSDDHGQIGWYMRVSEGAVTIKRGILDEADVNITADYQMILPLARMIMADNPEGRANAGKVIEEMTANGKFSRKTNIDTAPTLPWEGTLHDVLAKRTL